ncbi:MAG TPA: beta-galactosidase trimerization domain-containing protein, partial [Anaerolineales bacterium]|nr:beta-galactosidase trimerization domain-containing protein [Anaerolineales bacterium]
AGVLARFAQEQYHAGLLNHDASPNVGFFDLQEMAGERDLMEKVVAEPVRAQVAMIFNYDDLWALQLQPHRSGFTYLRLAFTWYRALLALGISVDFRPLGAELSGYKMVLAPGLFLGSADLADSLCEYASTGGTLVLGVRSGFKTPSNLVTDQPLPGVFRDLAGVGVREWHALPNKVGYALESELPGLAGEATVWAEALSPSPSPEGRGEIEVLARYETGPFAGEAALTVHKLRDGQVVYCGWHPTQQQAEAMIGELATRVGVEGVGALPAGVFAFRRGRFTVVLNFTEAAQDVQVGAVKGRVPSRGVWVVENGEGHPF